MLCRNCGSQIPDNSKFCVNCGIKIEDEQAGVVQKRVISDKHYSLEEISAQQEEHNSFDINKPQGVNLNKTSSTANLQNFIHSDQSQFSPASEVQNGGKHSSTTNTEPPLPIDSKPHKMKSAGFPDEQEPVKRPPISEPIVQNNNFSFGNTGTNNTNNGFQTPNNVPNNNFSFGNTNNNNAYNAYSPTAVSKNSDGNSKAAKLLIVIGIIIGIAMIVAIVFMITSGYYKTDNTSQTEYKNSSVANSDKNTTPVSSDIPLTEFSNLVYSNNLNCSIATEDKDGNVYYADGNGCINKIDSTGNSTIIYSADSFPSYLNWYDGRLYFICDDNEYTSTDNQANAEITLTTNKRICSISTDGTSANLKTHTNGKDISALFVSNGYMYYAVERYGIEEDSSAIFRQNINTKENEKITVINNSIVITVYEYKGSVYVQFCDSENYIGQIVKIDENDFSKKEYINTPTGTPYDYLYITIQNDRFYFVNCINSAEYSIYSMDMDGKNGKKIVNSTKCNQIAVYGDYIYYTIDSKNSDDSYTLYRIKTDGTENTIIKDKNVAYMSFAGNRIYYINSESGTIERINLDGSGITILN